MRSPRISSLRRGRHTAIESFASTLDRPGGLFSLDTRYLDYWPSPLLDIGLLEDIERLRGLPVARWNVLSEIGKPLAHQRIGHAAKGCTGRLHLDEKDQNILRDEITVYDNALRRPWSVEYGLNRIAPRAIRMS